MILQTLIFSVLGADEGCFGFAMNETDCPEPNDFQGGFDRGRLPPTLPFTNAIPNEHDCSYLENEKANLPLYLPARRLSPQELDAVLSNGIRRSGFFLYHTACANCTACEPSRVDVRTFVWRESFRRVLNRGERTLQVRIARPSLDEKRLELFNLHREERGLGERGYQYQSTDYESFLVESSCSETAELSFWHQDSLVAVSIVDCGQVSLSAVYTFFDPSFSKLSIGTYSILKQIELALASGRQYVYLGMYVARNPHLNYKSRFLPQERFVAGQWVRFT
jgi:arginyl-tRNA--protein-N-Asp/Glu arginylyltransferase